MLVDAHVHVGAWTHADFLGRSCGLTDVADIVKIANLGGVAILPTDQCDNAGLLASARGAIANGFDAALWMFAWARSGDTPEGQADREWIVHNASCLTGIKIHPSLSRQPVTAPGFAPVLELAARRDLVVLVHCGRWQEIASYRFAIEAAKAHRNVRFVLAHAGGDTPPLATAAAEMVVAERLDNVWFEFSGVREYWVIERNVRLLNAERYMMGSDYSLAHPLMYLGAIQGMNLSDSERDKLAGGSALSVLGPSLAQLDRGEA